MNDTKYCKDCLNMNCPEGRVNRIYIDAIACHLYTDTPPTVFENITTSPEVLTEKLVYPKGEKIRCVGTDHRYEYHMTYGSVLFPGITFEDYGEAFIKTLEKLNEVAK